MSFDPTPIWNDIRSRRPDPKKTPVLKLTKHDRHRVNKYAQILTDKVWKEICERWNAHPSE